ncbi:membrane dipeptidase [Alcaligenaceae bacterium]|nr:membrane dipeptidase [Alcaligenaceae bacterium]
MEHSDLHRSSIVFDGLVVAKWNREAFERMRQGGLTAANCTICIWQGVRETMANIAQFKAWFEEFSDIIVACRSVQDIRAAKRAGKVGIVLGWQNSSGIEDRIDLLPVYKELGVGFIQLTYNTQNYVASGCWEKRDGGLSFFGEHFVHEMNRVGIVVDLSHVGSRSASDAIAASTRPCAYTHICPSGLLEHPRNKTDDQLRAIVDKGGFVGVAAYAPFMKRGADSTLEDVIDMYEYVINVCGEDQVGIGTDFTEGQDEAFFDYVRKDKGHGRRMVPSTGTAPTVRGFGSLTSYPALTREMERRGWPERRIVSVLGENWLRFLERVW